MNYHLISSIIKGVWAINQDAALGYAPLINNIIGNSPVAFEFDEEQFKISAIDPKLKQHSYWEGWDEVPKGSIALVPLSGPLMKNDQYCGPVGMATLGQIIKDADESPNVDGIILKIDSPGGTHDGTVALANIIEATNKPVIAFADGLMASAALWVGASADEIIAADPRTEVGSVGVMLSFADMQPAYEKLGVKFHAFAADQSSEKLSTFQAIKSGDYEAYRNEVLNPLADDFINHMKTKRPNMTDEQLTGKVFFAQDVKGSIVDSIGNLDHALDRMAQLINDNQNEILIENNNSPTMSKQFLNVNASLGIDALEMSDEGVYLSAEQLQTLDTALAAEETPAAEEPTPEPEAATEPETTPEPVEATEPDPRDARIAELEGQLAAQAAAPAPDADVSKSTDAGQSAQYDDYHSDLAAAKEAMNMFN